MDKTILTPFQTKLLNILATDSYITKRFYFTGGTVLSEFYLQHRLSEDFDLLLLGSQMRKVTILTDLPKMLRPFDAKYMERFFLSFAKQLEDKIFVD